MVGNQKENAHGLVRSREKPLLLSLLYNARGLRALRGLIPFSTEIYFTIIFWITTVFTTSLFDQLLVVYVLRCLVRELMNLSVL
jgi:hypothetical protein